MENKFSNQALGEITQSVKYDNKIWILSQSTVYYAVYTLSKDMSFRSIVASSLSEEHLNGFQTKSSQLDLPRAHKGIVDIHSLITESSKINNKNK